MKSKVAIFLVSAVATAAGAGIAYGVAQSNGRQPTTPAPVVSSQPVTPVAEAPAAETPAKSKPASTEASPPVQANPANSQTPAETPPDTAKAPIERTIQSCVVKMARVDDPEPPLNVRSAPNTQNSKIVGTLKNGTYVDVVADQNGWLQIESPMQGWISRDRTETSCNQKLERLRFTQEGTESTIQDRFVGTGSHRYLLQAKKGQTLTITRREGPLPAVMTPDGKELFSGASDENRQTWTGTLPANGDYAFLMDSNYKGYSYEFTLMVK